MKHNSRRCYQFLNGRDRGGKSDVVRRLDVMDRSCGESEDCGYQMRRHHGSE